MESRPGRDLPQLTVLGGPDGAREVKLTRFDTLDGHAEVLTSGVPVRRVGEHLCCTVFDLMLAQYGVARPGLPGYWPTGFGDADRPYTPAWQEAITGVSATQVIRVAREFAHNAEESGGRSMIIMGAGICQWFHGDATYRAILAMLILTGSMGRNGGGWAHYVGPGEVPAHHRLGDHGDGVGLGPPAAADDRHRLLVRAHRPVAVRRVPSRRPRQPARPRPVRRHAHHGRAGRVGGHGLDAVLPAVRPEQPGSRGRGGRSRCTGSGIRCGAAVLR